MNKCDEGMLFFFLWEISVFLKETAANGGVRATMRAGALKQGGISENMR